MIWGHCAEISLADYWLVTCGHAGSRLSPLHHRADRTHTGELAFRHHRLPFPNLATLDRLDYEGVLDPGRILEFKTGFTVADGGPASWQIAGQMLITGIRHASLVHLPGTGGAPGVVDLEADRVVETWLTGILTDWNRHLIAGTPPVNYGAFTPPVTYGCRIIPATDQEDHTNAG